ncbi:MAG: MFS transporter [Deltaproteobacteria bacterium]|nr:MFS transporter [Deltaproteobacteria bacterium]
MSDESSGKGVWRTLPAVFWAVVVMEFFERGAYYGLWSVLSVYMVDPVSSGGLGFTKPAVGLIKGTITPLLYALPILSGALADRFGYKRTLLVAFSLLTTGHFLSGRVTSYWVIFATLTVMALGAGTFKPIVSGTIARVTDKDTSSVAFGLYYWSINLGAFVFPLFLVTWAKSVSWSAVFYLSAACTGVMVLPTLLWFRDPPRPANTKPVGQVLREAALVLTDVRFMLMIVIYSGFWIMYFQMFDTVLWYLKDHVDMSPINAVVNFVLAKARIRYVFKFDAEHVTVINGGTIIALQLLISSLVKNTRALPTMIIGLGLGTAGFLLLAVSSNPWVFIAGMIVFSIGEMTAHPKYYSYISQIAPEDKKATYMGYSFLYGIIGSSVGGIVGAFLYARLVDRMHMPRVLWLLFTGLGVVTMLGLLAYDRWIAPTARTGRAAQENRPG